MKYFISLAVKIELSERIKRSIHIPFNKKKRKKASFRATVRFPLFHRAVLEKPAGFFIFRNFGEAEFRDTHAASRKRFAENFTAFLLRARPRVSLHSGTRNLAPRLMVLVVTRKLLRGFV